MCTTPSSRPMESVLSRKGDTRVTNFAPHHGFRRPMAHCSVSPPTLSRITSNLRGTQGEREREMEDFRATTQPKRLQHVYAHNTRNDGNYGVSPKVCGVSLRPTDHYI